MFFKLGNTVTADAIWNNAWLPEPIISKSSEVLFAKCFIVTALEAPVLIPVIYSAPVIPIGIPFLHYK